MKSKTHPTNCFGIFKTARSTPVAFKSLVDYHWIGLWRYRHLNEEFATVFFSLNIGHAKKQPSQFTHDSLAINYCVRKIKPITKSPTWKYKHLLGFTATEKQHVLFCNYFPWRLKVHFVFFFIDTPSVFGSCFFPIEFCILQVKCLQKFYLRSVFNKINL